MDAALAETPPKLLTAEEFGAMDFGGRRVELVERQVVELSRPAPRHGFVVSYFGHLPTSFAVPRGLAGSAAPTQE